MAFFATSLFSACSFTPSYGESGTFISALALHNSHQFRDVVVAGTEDNCGRSGSYSVESVVAQRSPYSKHLGKSKTSFNCSALLAFITVNEPGLSKSKVKHVPFATVWQANGISWFTSADVVSNTGRCLFSTKDELPTPPPASRSVSHVHHAVLCAKNSGRSYYHTIFDNLLGCASAFDMLLADSSISIILDDISSLNVDAFELFGISPSRLLSLAESSFTVESLYFPSYTGCGSTSYSNMQIFQHVVHKLHSDLYSAPASAILIIDRGSHSPSCIRCLRNHDELVRSARREFSGKEVIEFTKHSMRETVSLFARTRLVIAPHGAGLTNLLFLPLCAGLVEIHTSTKETSHKLNYCYLDMAVGLGVDYDGLAPIGIDMANISRVLAAARRLYHAPCRPLMPPGRKLLAASIRSQ